MKPEILELAQRQALETAVRISEGALDYSGGYRHSPELLEAYRAGIRTVTTCLKAYLKDKNDSQVKALIGVEQQQPPLESSEQYRQQMAAISTAALGHFIKGDSMHPDYLTSALCDVAELYEKYKALRERQSIDITDLQSILKSVQDGECSVSRAIECIELSLAGRFKDGDLPPAQNHFGEDDLPIEVVKSLCAVNAELLALVKRYRTETPLSHQPHMIAHLADQAIENAEKASQL